jgi:hypothetical protein
MNRRLGRLGIFVEVNGKYYLSEGRLKQLEGLRRSEGVTLGSRKRMLTLRIVKIVMIVLFVVFMAVGFFVQSWEIRAVSFVFLAVWLVISTLQIYHLSRIRKKIFYGNVK